MGYLHIKYLLDENLVCGGHSKYSMHHPATELLTRPQIGAHLLQAGQDGSLSSLLSHNISYNSSVHCFLTWNKLNERMLKGVHVGDQLVQVNHLPPPLASCRVSTFSAHSITITPHHHNQRCVKQLITPNPLNFNIFNFNIF